jgi:predicted nucleic acid-binding protein
LRYTVDTNVISTYRIEELPDDFYMSAVVLSERMTAANDEKEFRAYRAAWREYSAEGTLLVPTPGDWLAAGRLLFEMAQQRKQMAGNKSPRRAAAAKQELAMDALIAASARRERITVVTDDTDFDAFVHVYSDLKLMKGAEFFGR